MIQASRGRGRKGIVWHARITPTLIECHRRGFRVVYRITPLVGASGSRLEEAYVSGDVARGWLVVGRSAFARFKGDQIVEVRP